jgi:hypothetical protein
MIDLFESIIKTHTVVILSEYVRHNKLSDSAKGLLAQGLRTPSLGTWQLFSRVLFEELQKDDHSWSFADFPSEFTALDKALNAEKTNVIAMRNGYAHGATPSDEQCEADVQKFEPFLLKLMGLNWLMNTSFKVKDGLVLFTSDNGGSLCLHPLLLYRDEACEASFAFFNDLKNDKVGLLNYPLGKHYKERAFYSEFLEILPLNEWKSSGNNEFQQRIDELTETFKGRTLEREKLLQFVASNNKGYLSIQGNPGIGKSALIAQFFKDLKHHEISKSLRTVEYFIRRGTQQAQVEFMLAYLIRRTDEHFPAGKEIRAEGKTTYDVQSQLFAKWRMWSEQNKGQKLLFLIDGLDEGAENIVLAYLPRENFENILFIYGSRPGGHKSIDDLWATLPTEHHTKLELQGLGKEDIRALIYEVANKYEIERESPWIDAVQIKSQGNPLYLKLLCDSLEHGGVAVNDVHALPDKIDEYYKAILNRYAQDAIDGDSLLFSLFTFAAARDYLTNAHIGHINKLGPAATQRVCTTLKEVLYENPLTEEVLDYQLFHESFREYLIREFAKEVQDASYRIIDFCSRWYEFEGSWEQRYALEHYAFHLSASGKAQHHETLLNLITSQPFTATQKKVLKNFEATKRLFQLALMKSIEFQKEDLILESALQLVDLKYEEANDAPQVVALASSGIPGDIELALKRIEQFGGADEVGIQRKCTLYMLCLMELTLLDGRNNPNRKTLIKKLLDHFDEHLPTDHSILSWSDFFSSYLVFLMACEWAELGLDYMIVNKRTRTFYLDDVLNKGPYSDFRLCVLLEVARGISDKLEKSVALSNISSEFAKKRQLEVATLVMQEALETARGLGDEYKKSIALSNISGEFAKQGQFETAVSVLPDALEIAQGISDEWEKSDALYSISGEFAKQGQFEAALEIIRGISDEWKKSDALSIISGEFSKQGQLKTASSAMRDALETARGISDDYSKSLALSTISGELAKQGNLDEALVIAQGISDEWNKSVTLSKISNEFAYQGQLDTAALVMQGALETALEISGDEWGKSGALSTISAELAKQGRLVPAASVMQNAIEIARGISEDWRKSLALSKISSEFAKQELLDASASVMQDALKTAPKANIIRERFDGPEKRDALSTISGELAKQSKFDAALEIARGLSEDWAKSEVLSTISGELAKQRQIEAAASVMQDALEITLGISNYYSKSGALSTISIELAKQGQLVAALETACGISDEWKKNKALSTITAEFAKQECLEAALETARGINDNYWRIEALLTISRELFTKRQLDAAAAVMQDALETALEINDDFSKSRELSTISSEFTKHGHLEAALDTARGIKNNYWKNKALSTISGEFSKQGHLETAASVMQDAIETARGISDPEDKIIALSTISSELAKQRQKEAAASVMQDALNTARGISDERKKSEALSIITGEFAKQECLEAALETAQGISDEWENRRALSTICFEFTKQGKLKVAENIGWEISQIAERHDLWKKIASTCSENKDWPTALKAVLHFQSDETRFFYLKGWVHHISVNDVTNETLAQALPLLIYDSDSIEELLQKYAQNQLFFGSPTPGSLLRLNHSLNIQWLLDICQRFPKEQIPEKSSSNLKSWIDEISDSDDRDDIRTWAEKVAAGTMTEEKFKAKVLALF